MDNRDKSWLLNKIQSFLRKELYFQTVDLNFYFESLKFALSLSNDFTELKSHLEKMNLNQKMKFVRKGSHQRDFKFFEYPPLHFQCESLFKCWEEIIKIQMDSGEDLSRPIEYQRDLQFLDEYEELDGENSALDAGRNSYGNKPNLHVRISCPEDFTVQKDEERKAFPLNLDFKFEYNSFRQRIIKKCEIATKKKAGKNARDIIFIQTDLKNFFHELKIIPLTDFFEKQFPEAKNLARCLKEINELHGVEDLPIGWVLSRYIANIVLQHFHHQLRGHLQRNVATSLNSTINYGPNQPLSAPKKIDLKLEDIVSYVDDFVFLFSIDSKEKDFSREAIGGAVIEESENLINKVIPGNVALRFYKANEAKTKIYRLNSDTVFTLKSNFPFFKTADEYFLDDPDIRARIEDVLLPHDNDLTLNPNEQFKKNLMNLQKLVITNNSLSDKEIEDLISHIKVKIEKSGPRYIRSVFGFLRLVALTDANKKSADAIRKKHIPELFEKCKKDYSYSSEWIKFFSGYIQFLKSVDYARDDVNQYFRLLNKAISLMKKRSENDVQILQLVRNDSAYKIVRDTEQFSHRKRAIRLPKNSTSSILVWASERVDMIDFLCRTRNPAFKGEQKYTEHALAWVPSVVGTLQSKGENFLVGPILETLKEFQNNKSSASKLLFCSLRVSARVLQLQFREEQQRTDFFWSIKNDFSLGANAEFRILDGLLQDEEKLKEFFLLSEQRRLISAYSTFFSNDAKDVIFKHLSRIKTLSPIELIAAYFHSSRLNDEIDFYRYFSSLLFKPDLNQIGAWSALPITFRKTGIVTSEVLKKVYDFQARASEEMISVDLLSDIDSFLFPYASLGDGFRTLKMSTGKIQSPTVIDLDAVFSLFDGKDGERRAFKVTVAPLSMNEKRDLRFDQGFIYENKAKRAVDLKIRNAIDEAIRQKSAFLVFPELCLPRSYLQSYLRLLSGHNIVLVGGLEYFTDSSAKAYNSTIISVPVSRSNNPGGKGFIAFEQIKHFPSAEEAHHLDEAGFKYKNGDTLYIFKSSFWGDFAVLTCSDFLSLGFRWLLQGRVQSIFVPAQNTDSTTYDHISESSIRDLHCIAIVCNNSLKGSSHCYAPYYDKLKREIFKRVGSSEPECHTFEIDPKIFRQTQSNAKADKPFRNPKDRNDHDWGEFTKFKQLPPDWGNW